MYLNLLSKMVIFHCLDDPPSNNPLPFDFAFLKGGPLKFSINQPSTSTPQQWSKLSLWQPQSLGNEKLGVYLGIISLHPLRLTWNIIMEVWKIIFLSKWVINLLGCNKQLIIRIRTNSSFFILYVRVMSGFYFHCSFVITWFEVQYIPGTRLSSVYRLQYRGLYYTVI